MKKTRLSSIFNLVILIAFGALSFFPIYMVVINSFKSQDQIFNSVLQLPTTLHFTNYTEAFSQINIVQALWNSLTVTGIGIAGIVLFGSMAGYKLARTPGKLSQIIFLFFMSSMLIPFHSIMITLTRMANTIGIQGSTVGLGIIYIGLGVSMSIFLTAGFVKTIPKELEEAAKIDGANEMQTFIKVIFPLLSPILVTIGILNLLWIWNDFLLPLLMLTNVNDYTIILSVNTLFGEYNNDWPKILASLVITTIPLITAYVFLQKYILDGIAEGAVKG
ncbi:carbohydrate ABC transporter permease [Amphibacillus cookii]|uniref:carbohydrate ABC transporter permease n=1 Tax=Amphibacillus cookii TaxID=767787 RepID=UPI00195D2450|nr:carbohydrate ABC transporter permease [Amphibacillus cookii]MBM7541107.1 raffinose/stachyose/melibiose transport system permease protein [Amphibacillus cookii]